MNQELLQMTFRKLILSVIIVVSVIGAVYISKVTISGIHSSGEKGYSVFIFLYPVIMAITFIAIIISMLTKIQELRYYKILFFIEIVYYIVFIVIMSIL